MGENARGVKKDNRGNPKAAPINGFRFILSYCFSKSQLLSVLDGAVQKCINRAPERRG